MVEPGTVIMGIIEWIEETDLRQIYAIVAFGDFTKTSLYSHTVVNMTK